MYLYRSFGNLMEEWVNEDRTSPQPRLLRDNTLDALGPPSDMGINPRSESVDSGVELASCGTPCRATSSSDSPTPPGEGFAPALASQSPFLSSPVASCCSSSSSPSLCPTGAEEEPAALHLKVKRALLKADSRHWKSTDKAAIRQPRASFLPKRHASELARCPRSQSFDTRRRFDPSEWLRQMSDLEQRSESAVGLGVTEEKRLSPGLFYLEQVCQMLEEVARQQLRGQAPRAESAALREDEGAETPETCQTDSTAAEEDRPASLQVPSAPQQPKSRHFRQRSASDTTFAALHLKKLNASHRGQLLSTNNLLERVEEDSRREEATKERSHKAFKNWRVKLAALRRTESSVSDIKSQQVEPSEKSSARRRLSQLFRRKKAQLV
ncbi:uncharacterized protein si:dkey-106l3.7 [Kryptolebias marmoratus]|uniref:uncharacterized protein si:dkey-106l3.7 n=1 Tax=Kryptolebias marmoratus TaxID=37003 RepID=UPI0007F901CD|nr:uncharacterized protein si:dkey-106l3.7 [Kryptolebias marmoratus]